MPVISPRAIRIYGHDFKSSVCCTGEQLASILDLLPDHFTKLDWFFSDVETNDNNREWASETQPISHRIGDMVEFRDRARKTNQFFSGVFLGAESELDSSFEWWTEDQPFRSLQGAKIEIRTFDTTYFEIYGLNQHELEELMSATGGTLLSNNETSSGRVLTNTPANEA